MKKTIFCLLMLCLGTSALAQEEIRLYEGKAPGNGEIAVQESVNRNAAGEIVTIAAVSDPSLTVYLPPKEKATGVAVILCAGGGLRMLSWKSDVIDMAKFLNDKGIAAIGLKYRLHTDPPKPRPATAGNNNNPFAEMALNVKIAEFDRMEKANANPDKSPEACAAIDRSIMDADRAMEIVKQNAAKWNIDPSKIGYLGFSAGGGVAIGATVKSAPERKPAFLATAFGPSLIDVDVPQNAPALFIAVRADHQNVAAGVMALFMEWKKAGAKAEMHVYDDGPNGLATPGASTPSGAWRDSFYRWLQFSVLQEGDKR